MAEHKPADTQAKGPQEAKVSLEDAVASLGASQVGTVTDGGEAFGKWFEQGKYADKYKKAAADALAKQQAPSGAGVGTTEPPK